MFSVVGMDAAEKVEGLVISSKSLTIMHVMTTQLSTILRSSIVITHVGKFLDLSTHHCYNKKTL